MMKTTLFLAITIAALSLWTACDKNNVDGQSTFKVRMTDTPAVYDQVNVDIQSVEVHSDQDGWVPLQVNSGIYNLLDFTNGKDTLIASANLPSGTVSQIRLGLGNQNTVVKDGQSHNLSTPSAQQSGLKLQVHKELEPGITYVVLLDFDASKSIVETGSGKFILKPVINVITDGIDGIITGKVNPAVNSLVYGILNNDTTSTYTDASGEFMLQGLEGGTYEVQVYPDAPYNDTTITNVGVTVGNITDIGTVQLTQ